MLIPVNTPSKNPKGESEDGLLSHETTFIPIEEAVFRNYVNSKLQERVSEFYHNNHKIQTYDYVVEKKKELCQNLGKYKMTIWDAVQYLNEVIDYR